MCHQLYCQYHGIDEPFSLKRTVPVYHGRYNLEQPYHAHFWFTCLSVFGGWEETIESGKALHGQEAKHVKLRTDLTRVTDQTKEHRAGTWSLLT